MDCQLQNAPSCLEVVQIKGKGKSSLTKSPWTSSYHSLDPSARSCAWVGAVTSIRLDVKWIKSSSVEKGLGVFEENV